MASKGNTFARKVVNAKGRLNAAGLCELILRNSQEYLSSKQAKRDIALLTKANVL